MSRRVRIVVGLLILVVSISLLVWGFRPLDRETRIQRISPSDLGLPTPTSLLVDPVAVS